MKPAFPIRFGKYILMDRISESAMSELFLACREQKQDNDLLIVIKKLHPLLKDPASQKLFAREIRLGTQLIHPNIVRIHEVGEVDSQFFFAMEWIYGKSLRQLIEKCGESGKTLPRTFTAGILLETAQALDYAHNFRDPGTGQNLPVVHRDLSPHNIMISYDGKVKLIDFGIAKVATSVTETLTDVIRGKPSYLSPEQITSKRPDPRSDLFSFGSILYEVLTGQKAFDGDSTFIILEKIRGCDSFAPETGLLDVQQEFKNILRLCFQKNIEQRIQSADQLFAPLNQILQSGDPSGREPDFSGIMKQLFQDEIAAEQEKMTGFLVAAREARATPHFQLQTPPGKTTIGESGEKRVLIQQPLKATPASNLLAQQKPLEIEIPFDENELEKKKQSPWQISRWLRNFSVFSGILALFMVFYGFEFLEWLASTSGKTQQGKPITGNRLRLEIYPTGGDHPSIVLNGKVVALASDHTIAVVPNSRIQLMIVKQHFNVFKNSIWIPELDSETNQSLVQTIMLEPVEFGSLILSSDRSTQVDISDGTLSWRVTSPSNAIHLPPGTYQVRFHAPMPFSERITRLKVIKGQRHMVAESIGNWGE